VNQAKGELTNTEQGQLSQVISTLRQEISSGQSLSTGMSQFWALLHSNELPSSLNAYLTQYAEYLSASQGS
jgi:type II secretory pathway component PulF